MNKKIITLFKYSWWLYVVAAGLLSMSLNKEKATLNRLDKLKWVEDFLWKLEGGTEKPSPDNLRWTMRYYKEIVNNFSKSGTGYGTLGYCSILLNHPEEAIGYYKKAIEYEPSIYTYPMDLAKIYFKIHDLEQSKKYYLAAIAALPRTKEYFENIKHWSDNRDVYLHGLSTLVLNDLRTDSKKVFLSVMDLSYIAGDFQNMEVLGLRAVAAFPDNAELHYELGLAFFKLNQYEPAVQEFSKAIANSPRFIEAYYARAAVAKILGRENESLADLQQVTQLKKENAPAFLSPLLDEKYHSNIDIQNILKKLSVQGLHNN